MHRELHKRDELPDLQPMPSEDSPKKRPLIGVPTGRERSQRFYGLPLYIMNQTYIRTLEKLGALPVMIPLQMTDETLRGIFERLDGIFLPGGEDMDPGTYDEERHPQLGAVDKERDRTELLLTRWALAEGMPFFGICRGVQVLNVACGGALYQDLHSQRPDLEKHDYFPPKFERFRISHQIDIEADSRVGSALGKVHEINSMHHQGIKRVGNGLRVVATAPDGLAEALEMPALPFAVGVQWHPEELAKTDQHSANLFYRFVETAASDWQDQVPSSWPGHFRQLLADAESRRPEKPLAVSLPNPAYANGVTLTPVVVVNGGNGSNGHGVLQVAINGGNGNGLPAPVDELDSEALITHCA
ncbi:MAG: gamma-glutamyl-gamma-aminobutyrate hydrolase family protein [Caldilineaceae bacterium]|nr:gamma-glutamyl-gamma-aminobutyrate hydrolase family protein [Caldilineaceae bacterium]MBP8106396.1 gamma-glutamyl-gamma-aminobutyrate hydrolase family protein [Caldilineaceae bacterium]MBP8121421.1 gamma-glutamyl-gamma-aminobutyrate hydrolase family protein [Caldilineaceae bacterium]MBP9072723.1 gamma-glutamyl-gamma-aminobutyrate hydrolase family protein [Caldilineaceae bacterium]